MTILEFRDLALSFPGTVENPHFDRIAYKIPDKKIFATLHEKSGTANLKFSEADQAVFCTYEGKVVYPVPNKWGQHGWTTIILEKFPKELMLDALDRAYRNGLISKKKK